MTIEQQANELAERVANFLNRDNEGTVEQRLNKVAGMFVELLKDKELIDKMEQFLVGENDLDVCHRKRGYFVSELFNPDYVFIPKPTLREAIDSAMQKGKE